jgi:hydroxymethylbilane synthase
LARWQAEYVAGALGALPDPPQTELVLIKSEGDRIQDIPLSKVHGKAFFTKEIEEALMDRRVDVAVHSLKDLATANPPGLCLGAVMEREDPRDVLLFSPALSPGDSPVSPEKLPRGARVGTSSLRRRALLRRWRPDLEVRDLRGNVPTRIGKLDAGEYDAIILACAGVRRLGLESRISAFLPLDTFLPAVSQGSVAVQIRSGDQEVSRWVGNLDHREARLATAAERAFLRRLEGGCQIPVGAYGEVRGGDLVLRGIVSSLDGSRGVQGEVEGSVNDAERLGTDLAEDLLGRGAEEILEEIRRVSGGIEEAWSDG